MKKTLIIASAAVLLAGCTRDTQLTVVNDSAATLTNIVVAAPGFSKSIGSIASEAKQEVPLKSDSGEFKLEFDANGKHFSEDSGKDPWDGMKEVIMTVSTNFSVTSSSVTTF